MAYMKYVTRRGLSNRWAQRSTRGRSAACAAAHHAQKLYCADSAVTRASYSFAARSLVRWAMVCERLRLS